MDIVAIAVVANNQVLGDGHDQPFKIKKDWARFKRTTMGHPMLMGRATFQVVGALPGRTTIVVTHRPETLELPETNAGTRVFAVQSLESGLALGRKLALDSGKTQIFVCGGGHIYAEALPFCTHLELTQVHAPAQGMVKFPDINPSDWIIISKQECEENGLRFDFVRYAATRIAGT